MQDFDLLLVRFFIFPLLALLIMYAVKLLDDARTPFKEDDEIAVGQNLAISLRKGGIYMGIALGLSGSLLAGSAGTFNDIWGFIKAGVVMIAAMYAAFFVNDRIILRKIGNDRAVAAGNTAVGIVECASYTGSGIILHGCFSGEGGGLAAAAVFFLLAQAAFVCAFAVYDLLEPRRIAEEIERKGNCAEAMDVAGMLIAFSIILRAGTAGPFTGWLSGIKGFGVYSAAGLFCLLVYRFLGNRIFVPRVVYDREIASRRNLAVAALSSSVQIAVAMVIAAVS